MLIAIPSDAPGGLASTISEHFGHCGAFTIVGDLTIRGETRSVTLDATFDGTGTDPWGGSRAGFGAKTTIDRRDFGLTWNQALETGGVLVGHDITIALQVQGVLQEELAAV